MQNREGFTVEKQVPKIHLKRCAATIICPVDLLLSDIRTDLYLHYLPLFHHKTRFIATVNARLLKILSSSLLHLVLLLLALYFQGFMPMLSNAFASLVLKVRVTGGVVMDNVDQKTNTQKFN